MGPVWHVKIADDASDRVRPALPKASSATAAAPPRDLGPSILGSKAANIRVEACHGDRFSTARWSNNKTGDRDGFAEELGRGPRLRQWEEPRSAGACQAREATSAAGIWSTLAFGELGLAQLAGIEHAHLHRE